MLSSLLCLHHYLRLWVPFGLNLFFYGIRPESRTYFLMTKSVSQADCYTLVRNSTSTNVVALARSCAFDLSCKSRPYNLHSTNKFVSISSIHYPSFYTFGVRRHTPHYERICATLVINGFYFVAIKVLGRSTVLYILY